MEVGGQRHAPASLPRETDSLPILQEAGCAVQPASLAGVRSPDGPSRNESLYRLSYPGPHTRVLISPWPYEERNKLQRPNSNFPSHSKKKKSEGCPSNQVSAGSNDLHVGRKMATFQLFFSVGSG